jgi:hypothetical protein
MPSTYICSKGATHVQTCTLRQQAGRSPAAEHSPRPHSSTTTVQFPLTTWAIGERPSALLRGFTLTGEERGRELQRRGVGRDSRPETPNVVPTRSQCAQAKKPAERQAPALQITRGREEAGDAPVSPAAGKLIDGIQSSRFPVGSFLPREIELSAIHKISRQTVRHAIAEFAAEGSSVGANVWPAPSASGLRSTV